MTEKLKIVPYDDALAGAFERLNRAWIERFFTVEAADQTMFTNPRASIIEPGGEIFFAQIEGVTAGVCAAQKLSATDWELAKLGVDERFQGRGLGRLLCEKVIAYCWAQGARRIVIETNSILGPARSLYLKLGFKEFTPDFTSPFTRANVFLEMRRRASGEGLEAMGEGIGTPPVGS